VESGGGFDDPPWGLTNNVSFSEAALSAVAFNVGRDGVRGGSPQEGRVAHGPMPSIPPPSSQRRAFGCKWLSIPSCDSSSQSLRCG
jgi:hypothetical protein